MLPTVSSRSGREVSSLHSAQGAELSIFPNRLANMFYCLPLEVGQVVNLSGVNLDLRQHLVFARTLDLPGAVVSNVPTVEVLHFSILHGITSAAQMRSWANSQESPHTLHTGHNSGGKKIAHAERNDRLTPDSPHHPARHDRSTHEQGKAEYAETNH